MTKLTIQFNEATVKKGETFQISLPTGGLIGTTWEAVDVVQGKAALVSAPKSQGSGCTGPFSAEWSFRAEEASDIEIVAREFRTKKTETFRIHAK